MKKILFLAIALILGFKIQSQNSIKNLILSNNTSKKLNFTIKWDTNETLDINAPSKEKIKKEITIKNLITAIKIELLNKENKSVYEHNFDDSELKDANNLIETNKTWNTLYLNIVESKNGKTAYSEFGIREKLDSNISTGFPEFITYQ